jgi:hypothetical protein
LTGFSDADFAGDVDVRKSTTGIIFFLTNNPITSAPSTPLLRVDNKSIIALIKIPVLHGQSKHIKMKYHVVRKSTENSQIKVEFIRSEE